MKIISQNKKAHHDYFLLDTYEAGIELKGTEIKSVRLGNVNLKDSFVRIKNDEVYVENISLLTIMETSLIMKQEEQENSCFIKKKSLK